jgi:hypothetical protein
MTEPVSTIANIEPEPKKGITDYEIITNPKYAELIKTFSHERRKSLCLQEMKLTVEQIGVWNINKSFLGRRYCVTDHTIANWLDLLLSQIPKTQLNHIKIDFESAYKKIIKSNRMVLVDDDRPLRERQKAAEIILDAMDKFTRFLEDYGYKEKAESQINLNVSGGLDLKRMLEIASESEVFDDDKGRDTNGGSVEDQQKAP